MPRTYSYDYFQNPKREVNYIPRHDKKQYADSQPKPPDAPKFHYGKQHAATEEFLAAKQMNDQLEELAGIPKGQKKRARKGKSAEQAAEPSARTVDLPPPPIRQGAPIGALPVTDEPAMSQAAFRDLFELALGHVRMVRMAARDLTVASLRLAKLPLDAASLVARRWAPRHA